MIKSRLQGAPQGTYKGFIDAAVKTIRADGVSALFKGFAPAMLRVRLSRMALVSYKRLPRMFCL